MSRANVNDDDEDFEAGEDYEAPDYNSMTKPELVDECQEYSDFAERAWDLIPNKPIAECSKPELVEAFNGLLEEFNEFNPDRFPLADDDENE